MQCMKVALDMHYTFELVRAFVERFCEFKLFLSGEYGMFVVKMVHVMEPVMPTARFSSVTK